MDRYGLIIPSKEKKQPIFPPTVPTKKANVFGEESDSEEDAVDWVTQSLKVSIVFMYSIIKYKLKL